MAKGIGGDAGVKNEADPAKGMGSYWCPMCRRFFDSLDDWEVHTDNHMDPFD